MCVLDSSKEKVIKRKMKRDEEAREEEPGVVSEKGGSLLTDPLL